MTSGPLAQRPGFVWAGPQHGYLWLALGSLVLAGFGALEPLGPPCLGQYLREEGCSVIPQSPFVLPHMSLTTVPKGMHHSLALHLPEDELVVQNVSSKIAQLVCARAGAPLCIPLKASPVLLLGL